MLLQAELELLLTKLGDAASDTANALEKMVTCKEEIFTESIKEYQLYVNTLRNVLKNRDHMQVCLHIKERIVQRRIFVILGEGVEPSPGGVPRRLN